MNKAVNHYTVLKVSQGATEAEIKTAYRKLARRLHPDAGATAEQVEEFKQVSIAYEVLGDGKRRSEYDRELRALQRPSGIETVDTRDLIGNIFDSFLRGTAPATWQPSGFRTARRQSSPQRPLGDVVKEAKDHVSRGLSMAGPSVEEATRRLMKEGRVQEATQLHNEYANLLLRTTTDKIKRVPSIAQDDVSKTAGILVQLGRTKEAKALQNEYADALVEVARHSIERVPTVAWNDVKNAARILSQIGRGKEVSALHNEYADGLVGVARKTIVRVPTIAKTDVENAARILRQLGRDEEAEALSREHLDALAKQARR